MLAAGACRRLRLHPPPHIPPPQPPHAPATTAARAPAATAAAITHLRLELALTVGQLSVAVDQGAPLLLHARRPRLQRRRLPLQRILAGARCRGGGLALCSQALRLRLLLALQRGGGGGALALVPLLLRALRRLQRLQPRLRPLQVGGGGLQLALRRRHLHLERLGGAA